MSSHTNIDFTVHAGGPLTGGLQIPGDKSISHRALMLGTIAEGETHVSGFLEGEDTLATLEIFRTMGVRVERPGANELLVHGVGLRGLRAPDKPLYLGNSGTAVRLVCGLLVGQAFDSELRGDASLTKRPMRRITEPLQQMDADIHCSGEGTLPIIIHGGRQLNGITFTMPVASAQLKSALLLAGLYASGTTCIVEPAVTRDHTERMLDYFGCPVERSGNRICIHPGILKGRELQVPSDISSAAFFMVAASIVEGSDLLLERIGINPTRHAVIEILQRMGADIVIENETQVCGEPVADIRVKYTRLKGIHIPEHLVPIAIDEFPAILVAAAYAEGQTILSGAAELRVKESDRIDAMASGLKSLGIDADATVDGMIIEGGRPHGGVVNSFTDHRIAMAFTVAGFAATDQVKVRDCANVNTSFPGFADKVRQLGIDIAVEGAPA